MQHHAGGPEGQDGSSGILGTAMVPTDTGATGGAGGPYREVHRVLVAAVRAACPPWLAAQAEDLVQEAMLKLWRGGHLDEGKCPPPSSYVWRVAHSVLVDEIRRRQRRREVPLEGERGVMERESEAPGPDRIASARTAAEALRECLRALGDDARRAVGLRILGHRVREIARLLGWNEKKAENTVYRGLATLRRCLGRKGVEP